MENSNFCSNDSKLCENDEKCQTKSFTATKLKYLHIENETLDLLDPSYCRKYFFIPIHEVCSIIENYVKMTINLFLRKIIQIN